MKRLVSLLLTFVMLFAALTTLASCGKPKDNGAEINIYLGSTVFDFDPSDYYVSSNAERVLSLIYEPLFSINKNGKLECAAAEDYEIDEEKREIIIEIRESYWSDNTRLKSADFVYAWCERIINPINANPAAALFLDIEGVREAMNGEGSVYDVGIKPTEMDKITINYREGADCERILKNLASVATAPVRQDVVENNPTSWSKSSVITNGPFKVKSYTKDYDDEKGTVELSFELTRNLGYHQDYTVKDYDNKVNPGLLYGTYTFEGNDLPVSYSDIENKVTFIMADASLADRAAYKKKADVADDTSTYTYVFNTQHPLFNDPNVRKALSLAIDREAIIEAITFGKAADGFIPDVSGGSKKDLISTKANIKEARQYLSSANRKLINDYKSFTLTVNSDEQSLAIAEIVKAAWAELGFEVTIEALTPVESRLSDGSKVLDSGIQYRIKSIVMSENGVTADSFDVIAVDWQTYSVDALAGLASLTSNLNGMGRRLIDGTAATGGTPDSSVARTNLTGWSNASYDNYVLKASACANAKERARLLAEAERYLIEQMPVCPLVFNQSFVFSNSKISKLSFDGLGNLCLTKVKLAGYNKYFKPEKVEE